MWFDRTSGVLHRRRKCVRWNEKQHGHEVEEVDAEAVPDLDAEWEPCGNCLPAWLIRRLRDEEVAA